MHQNKNQNKHKQHEPVLLSEVIDSLKPKPQESFLDLTAGYGGHAEAIIGMTGSLIQAVLVDRDAEAIKQLQSLFNNKVQLIKDDFYSASKSLLKNQQQFDLILADLGVSSPHLNEGNRGFSIKHDGPLDMRMDRSQTLSANEIVNSFQEKELADLIYNYGEEKSSRKIAKAIVEHRPIVGTSRLAEVIEGVVPRHSRIHPATKTFQALRIVVNDELALLEGSLPLWIQLLKPGGRIAIISYHSLEDKLVKDYFMRSSAAYSESKIVMLNKKPITPSINEIVHNPRARSAKLRAAAKIKTKGN